MVVIWVFHVVQVHLSVWSTCLNQVAVEISRFIAISACLSSSGMPVPKNEHHHAQATVSAVRVVANSCMTCIGRPNPTNMILCSLQTAALSALPFRAQCLCPLRWPWWKWMSQTVWFTLMSSAMAQWVTQSHWGSQTYPSLQKGVSWHAYIHLTPYSCKDYFIVHEQPEWLTVFIHAQ